MTSNSPVPAPAPSPPPSRFVWVDLETTGLDPERGAILEVACIITDTDLNVLETYVSLVGGAANSLWRGGRAEPERTSYVDTLLPMMDSTALAMHTENGLLDALRAQEASGTWLELEDCEAAICELLLRNGAVGAPLAGSTIGFDRSWCSVHMPEFVRQLHYRSVDVSSIKIVCDCWGIPRAPKGAAKHRALDDILESIEALRFAREHAFVKPQRAEPMAEVAQALAGDILGGPLGVLFKPSAPAPTPAPAPAPVLDWLYNFYNPGKKDP